MDDSQVGAATTFDAAVRCHQAGDLDSAITLYRQVVAVDPSHCQAFNNLGTALKAAKRLPEAIEAYQQAIRIEPDYVAAIYNLGTAFHVSGDLGQALVNYTRANDLRPGDPNTLYNLGLIAEFAQLYDYAGHLFQQVLEVANGHLGAMARRANCLRGSGQYAEALRVIEQVITLQPNEPRYWYVAGDIHMEVQDWPRASVCYQRCLALRPEALDAAMELARALLHANRFAEAQAVCQQVIHNDPSYGSAYLLLGQALRGLERHGEADEAEATGRRCEGTAGDWVMRAMTFPAIPTDEADIRRSRAHFQACLALAESFGGTMSRPEVVLTRTPFFFAYQGQNDLDLMVRLAQSLSAACPDLTWVAPHCRQG